MDLYSAETNLNRAVPDMFDGLKPVQRRVMWTGSKFGKDFIKTARLSGDCMGRYHPHGDASINDAISKMMLQEVSTMRGIGNWGGLIDPAAAARYTNCRLSEYGLSFFDGNYIHKEVTDFVPNYDDTDVEPVSLPAHLPNVLLNGTSGIGYGVTTSIPAFTVESVVAVLERMLKGEKLTPLDFAKTMKFNYKWGGKVVNTKANRAAWLKLFTSAESSIQFEAELVIDRNSKAVEINDWPPGLMPIPFLEKKARLMPETDHAYQNKGDTSVRIEMKSAYNYAQFDAFVEKLRAATRTKQSYKINVTDRQSKVVDGVVSFETRFLKVSIPTLLKLWLTRRLELEIKSLEYRMARQRQAISYTKLLIFAATKRDIILKALKAADTKAVLMRELKLTDKQATLILDLQLRKLSKLDEDQGREKLAEQEAHLRQLETWRKRPKIKVAQDLHIALESIQADRKFEATKAKDIKIS